MSRGTGLVTVGGSVLAALIASACCWLPLLLVTFGVSAAGVSAQFESVRPYFLALTTVLLGAGFYFSYFRRPTCQPGDACATPKPRLQRWNRTMLWIATVFVAGIAFFPDYVGLISTGEAAPPPVSAELTSTALRIDGMTCEACTAHVRQELLAVHGVEEASVSYPESVATIYFEKDAAPAAEELARAVARAGYKVTGN